MQVRKKGNKEILMTKVLKTACQKILQPSQKPV